MFKSVVVSGVLVMVGAAAPVMAQPMTENPDYRIRAEFRLPEPGPFAPGTSVGHAEFRVRSRFGQVYYGGVIRQDEYKFTVSLDYTEDQDFFPAQFTTSPYNTNVDVYIDNGFVGRVMINVPSLGLGELVYDSRHATFPDLPLPAGFPNSVSDGQVASVYAATGAAPAIGAPRPQSAALFEGAFGEAAERGDVDEDGNVNADDFAYLVANYDPYHRTGAHVGPVRGDFTGDNFADLADYTLMALNWTDSGAIPPVPAPIAPPCTSDINLSGSTTTQDVFDFFTLWFNSDDRADINQAGGVTVQDIFDFLTAWFRGC